MVIIIYVMKASEDHLTLTQKLSNQLYKFKENSVNSQEWKKSSKNQTDSASL